ncbi:hypothetical protein D3P09_17465 [Paenibacillus pinisoli]|uniref:Uncharacterized protein n=1 Tax=Paenibacillus pinisoli TaxID=1276110 RepID=A0A3A6PA20_9BACL|nr:hypothetical protein [Paenibacillus pinisoli]RJX37882.1 hypothetical protein D3P09_17465 [Paenibacillus pinisoli]
MAGEELQDRINRLNLDGRKKERTESAGSEAGGRQPLDPGPVHANEQWRSLYARVREVTEALRR